MSYLRSEPVRFVAAVRATLLVAVLFGLDLSDVQLAGLVVAVEAWLAFFVRDRVTPV